MLVGGINGSPNSMGNTGALIARVLEGARSVGAETVTFNLGEMEVKGCRACLACKDDKPCVIDDDMQRFYEQAEAIGAVVLGSPIYFDHITAQIKAFLDRLFPYRTSDGRNLYPKGVRAVVAITYEAAGPEAYDAVLDWMEKRLRGYFEMEVVGHLKKSGCPIDGTVSPDEHLTARAFDLGRRLVTQT